MTSRTRRRRGGLIAFAMAGVLLAGCSVDPPAPVRDPLSDVNQGEYPDELTVFVAVDRVGAGLNPHLASDQSAVTTAVATMALPSAFDSVVRDGESVWELGAILDSAEVISQDPFTVKYVIDKAAQWSDGGPITGDDFRYLWKQMTEQPNVVGGAGYRAISDVKLGMAGKEVTVTFHSPYPQWRELFQFLLPQHTLRDDPNGFAKAMSGGRPLAGGQFNVFSIDPGRDEVRLIRNDRYWLDSAALDQVVLRRAGSSTQTVQALRTGTFQLGVLSAGPALQAEFAAIPTLTTGPVPGPRSLGITLNTRSPLMRSIDIRRGILGIVDPGVLRLASAGDAAVTPFANTVFAPSDPGYFEVTRPQLTDEEISSLFAAAGYIPGQAQSRPAPGTTTTPSGPSGGAPEGVAELPFGIAPWQQAGRHMVVRIGVVSGDDRLAGAAGTLADQLRSHGVRAVVNTYPADELYGPLVEEAEVDVVVGWTGVGEAPQSRLATQMICPDEAMAAPGSVTPPPAANGRAGTPSGLCDPELTNLARTALFSDDPGPALRRAEGRYRDLAVYLPIYQELELAVVTDELSGVEPAGPVQTGVFADAANWSYR